MKERRPDDDSSWIYRVGRVRVSGSEWFVAAYAGAVVAAVIPRMPVSRIRVRIIGGSLARGRVVFHIKWHPSFELFGILTAR